MTPAERTAALSRMAHDEYLSLGLNDVPACLECQALSGLLTGLTRMARELPTKAEYIEALVAECAETLGLIDESDCGLGPVDVGPEPATCVMHGCACHDCARERLVIEVTLDPEAFTHGITDTRVSGFDSIYRGVR